MAEFEWPCDRRDAHGQHEVLACRCAMTESSFMHCPKHGPEGDPDDWEWCRGVKAHPLTQIGRAS